MTETSATIEARREQMSKFEQEIARLEQIEGLIRGLERDIVRLEEKRDRFAAYGKQRIPIPMKPVQLPNLGVVPVEPLRSVKTGNEHAAEVEGSIAGLRSTLKELQAEAASLQAGA